MAIERLRDIRVLLVSDDVRFLRVTAFLLRQRAFTVATAVGRGQAVRALEEGCTDVVVVDGDGSVGAAARLAGALHALHSHVSVVLCVARLPVAPLTAHVVSRFAPPDTLAAEIERSYTRQDRLEAGA
jgi:DNA-binding NtrC family response regulator